MNKIFINICMITLLMIPFPVEVLGEETDDNFIELHEITVKGEATPYFLNAGTVNTLTSDKIEDLNINRTSDLLKSIPGVSIGNYNQGGVANSFSMRGFRSCGHGGDAAVYIDGIPLNEGESHADGYADMNVIIPLEISRLDVYKGPSSVLYGNFARAGTLSFHTKKRGTYDLLHFKYGSYETTDIQGAYGGKLDIGSDLFNNSAFQFYMTDGYQENSRWLKGNFSTRFSYDISDKLDAAVSLRFHGSDWDAPGYIPKEQFEDEDWAKKQAVNAEDDGGNKRFYTQRIDLGYNLSDSFRFLYWGYTTQQDFTRFAKFGYSAGGQTERNYDRKVYGTGGSINFDTNIYSIPVIGVAGAEYYHEKTDWLRWNTSNRVRISKTQDRKFLINTLSLFGKLDVNLSRYFRPNIGLRYDDFGGSYKNNDPGSTDFKHDMNDYSSLSPKMGFTSQLFDTLSMRASYSEGFALPKGEAKYDPDINVDPVKVKQYEIGWTYKPWNILTFDIALYILDTKNEILEDPPGSGEYTNVGDTRRKGLELSTKFQPVTGLDFFADASFIDTNIRKNPDESLEGKDVRGVPKNVINMGAKYMFPWGLSVRAKWRHVGKYYIDSLNLYTYDGYDTVDTSLNYIINDKKGREYDISFMVDNVFDEHYSQAVWYGYGTANYAVSWPRTFWGRILIKW